MFINGKDGMQCSMNDCYVHIQVSDKFLLRNFTNCVTDNTLCQFHCLKAVMQGGGGGGVAVVEVDNFDKLD